MIYYNKLLRWGISVSSADCCFVKESNKLSFWSLNAQVKYALHSISLMSVSDTY